MKIIELNDVTKHFSIESKFLKKKLGSVQAAERVSFEVNKGEIIGLVGESGSGKTTVAKLMTGLLKPDSGNILLGSKPLGGYSAGERAVKIQMIFQDPFSSLNPRLSIGTILREAVRIRLGSARLKYNSIAIDGELKTLLGAVGLSGDITDNYPHQFSGGQRQRIAIARALAYNPGLIIADEPLSSLDVSTQAQIINLFLDLKEKFGFSYLFISHDLALISYLCGRILVMHNGRIIERGETETVMRSPKDIYTRKLVDSANLFAG